MTTFHQQTICTITTTAEDIVDMVLTNNPEYPVPQDYSLKMSFDPRNSGVLRIDYKAKPNANL